MTDRHHDDDAAKMRATIDDAIAELLLFGLANRDEAAGMMAVQAIIRIDDPAKVETVRRFIENLDRPIDG